MSDIYKPPEADLDRQTSDAAYAGFWLRFAATLLDTIWVVILTMGLGWLVYGAYYFSTTEILLGWADFLISYVLPFVLTLLFWAWKSATPGKMMLGMKIVDAESLQKVSNGRLVLRYLGYYLSTLGLMLGFLWVAWDKKKQGWHDKIARTVVIKG
jgi:uncharacterized RDD family membrane protein YckC